MDEREQEQGKTNRDGITTQCIIAEETNQEIVDCITKQKKRPKGTLLLAFGLAVLICGGIFSAILYLSSPKGYQNYTVQKEQYYVEYSEQYDYWDVITVEYPQLNGIKDTVQETLNNLMYDTAMDRVNYWHLAPSDEVKDFQEEFFTMFCSDVNCDVTYHSQYLLSMDYREYYSAGNPVWMTNGTERALTVDLLTGENYELTDILEINKEFMKLWDRAYSDELDEDYGDDEELELILSWFLQENEEINVNYVCSPFFYVTEDGDFTVGVSLDPILERAYTYQPINRSFYAELTAEEIEPFRKESDFWERYDNSETAGEVLPCEDKKENIWLGEDAGIWKHEY
ncbi:hypothetical protein [Parablautia muri]|uniref:Uncharacterized protein n=1 Tax=Parablautia muri TaxID=2320879 RepID=A0A9X5GQX2_9FIRM|nr:hypothetical protein [Parablautia muri]NBJ91465.1 hypothetical protein [Parablautia muri]